jgi:N-acetylglucosamine-6-sulfatase
VAAGYASVYNPRGFLRNNHQMLGHGASMRRLFGVVLSGLLLFILASACKPAEPDTRPNFLLIISDDQRYDQMEFMTQTKGAIFEQGVAFDHAYATTPQCCPSRSSILTGLYAHHHGVLTNSMELEQTTVVEVLNAEGYYTGLVGKYLNSYPNDDDPPRAEFDFWVGMHTGTGGALYNDPYLQVDGEWRKQSGYQTTILRNYVLDFLDRAHAQEQPFFLMLTPYAPHSPAIPASQDKTAFSDLPLYRPPSFNEADVSDKPAWMQALPLLTDEEIAHVDEFRLNQLRTLNSLDRSIDRIIAKLDEQGELDNTFILYVSDNGRSQGENRLDGGKIYPYEAIIHVPMGIRYPALISEPRVESRIVGNIDIAATIYDLAGVQPPYPLDGMSLIPLLQDSGEWRDRIMIEAWPKVGLGTPPYLGVRTEHYMYIETEGDLAELYDMEKDPHQLENLINDPEYADVITELRAYLAEQRSSFPPAELPERLEDGGDDD